MAHPFTLENVRQKLRIVKPKVLPDAAPVTQASQTTRVTAMDDGLNLNRHDGGIVKYTDISLLLAFRLDTDPDTWYIELFVYGQPKPFRLSQKTINYRQFLPEISQRSKDNFSTFFLYLIDRTDSVYVDENTLEFLKSGKMVGYPDFKLFEDYTRQLWFQLISWMKFCCDHCGEIYWVDDAKVSPQGAKTKCVKCQHIITVKRREKAEPVQPKAQQTAIPCPHCQYENRAGAQFCVMCQKPLGDFKGRSKEPSQPNAPQHDGLAIERNASPRVEKKMTVTEKLQEPQSFAEPDRSGLPLQAREIRMPDYSLGELAVSLQDDIKTLPHKFSWYSGFAKALQAMGFLLFAAGIIVAIYYKYVIPAPTSPEMLSEAQQTHYAIISVIGGSLASLVCLVVSNLITLNLETERNTRITALLLQRLILKIK